MFNLFKKNKVKEDIVLQDINQFPPFSKGFPNASSNVLLENKSELLKQIKLVIPISNEEYKSLIIPIINNLVDLVHLLPASEFHHHNNMSGLLSHSLESAYYAINASKTKRFIGPKTSCIAPKDRRLLEDKYQIGCFLSGLLHDIGKPLSDLTVYDPGSNKHWNWAENTIQEWLVENNIHNYYIRWNKNRHNNHHSLSPIALKLILTPKLISWLSEYNSDVLTNIYKAISNDSSSIFHEITKNSDSKSVHNHLQFTGPFSIKVNTKSNDQYLIWAMQNLLDSGSWKINSTGNKLWVISGYSGIFICWNEAVKDILHFLKQNNIFNTPKNPDDLADLLLERNIAVEYTSDKEEIISKNRYWKVMLDECNKKELFMLRIDNIQHIYHGTPPVGVHGIINNKVIDNKIKNNNTTTNDSMLFLKNSGDAGLLILKIINLNQNLIVEKNGHIYITSDNNIDKNNVLINNGWLEFTNLKSMATTQVINNRIFMPFKDPYSAHIKNVLSSHTPALSSIKNPKKIPSSPTEQVHKFIESITCFDPLPSYPFSITHITNGTIEVSGDMIGFFINKSDLILSRSKLRCLIVTSPLFVKKTGNDYLFKLKE